MRSPLLPRLSRPVKALYCETSLSCTVLVAIERESTDRRASSDTSDILRKLNLLFAFPLRVSATAAAQQVNPPDPRQLVFYARLSLPFTLPVAWRGQGELKPTTKSGKPSPIE